MQEKESSGASRRRVSCFIIDFNGFNVCSYFSFTSYYAGDSGLTISSMASLLTILLPLRRAVMHGGQSKSRGFIHNAFTTCIFMSYIYTVRICTHIFVGMIHSNASAMIIAAFLFLMIFGSTSSVEQHFGLPLNIFEHLRLDRRISATCRH